MTYPKRSTLTQKPSLWIMKFGDVEGQTAYAEEYYS
jgi:hypothetical protein